MVALTRIRPSACNWRAGHVEGVTCTEILNEPAEKLGLKLKFTSEQLIAVIASLLTFLRPVTITGQIKGLCGDPKDDMVLECALIALASHIVSSDRKHLLSMKHFRGIPIISPAEILRTVTP